VEDRAAPVSKSAPGAAAAHDRFRTFDAEFEAQARRVRSRLASRRLIAGLVIGMMAASAAAALLWWLRLDAWRPYALCLALAGAVVGAVFAARRRWSDTDVALYLDAKLESREIVSTALSLRTGRASDAGGWVVERASSTLASAHRAAVSPRVLRSWHLLAPLGLGLSIWLCSIPVRPPPASDERAPGSNLVKLSDLGELESIIALEKLDAPTPEQAKRLKELAEQAKKLRNGVREGLSKREAQAQIAKLRDDIVAQRLEFVARENRPGLEAAIHQLKQNALLSRAAEALGNGDLTAFDREMHELANRVERADREHAQKALEEAAKAARARGAQALADALEEQRRLFDERSARAEALRQLAESMRGVLDGGALDDLKRFGTTGSADAQRRLAQAMEKALRELDDDQRKALSENLRRELQQNGGSMQPMTKADLEKLAEHLATPEGQRELAERLKELAEGSPSRFSERQRALQDAERGAGRAESRLKGVIPLPMPGQGSGGKTPPNPKSPGSGNGGADGPAGSGDHGGETKESSGNELRAKAEARFNPGAPMQQATLGRAPARPGETAKQLGTGALGVVGPAEVGAVENTEVPEEYREQVGRYFQP
jgi:hypothetical protein